MRKRFRLLAIVCLVALALTASGPGLASGGQGSGSQGSGHGYGKFKDVDEGHWAYGDITMMEVKGVFSGYGNGNFGPQDPVTCIQLALLAVRVTGGQAAAGAMPLAQIAGILGGAWLDPTDPLPTWAGVRECLAYAYQQGYLNGFINMERVTFRPNAPASRLEVILVLIDAMGLTAAAQALNGTTIDAPDASTVPAWAVGYVALALDMGLLKGDDKGNLNLGSGVKRVEMAALLRRANNKYKSDCDDNVIEGKLTAVTIGTAPTITIETRAKELADYEEDDEDDGQTPPPATPPATPPVTPGPGDWLSVTYPVAADAKIFRDGNVATLADLVVGDGVEIRLLDGVAVVIDACTPETDDDDIENELEVSGPVVSAVYDTAGLLTAITIVIAEIGSEDEDDTTSPTDPTTPPTGPVVGSEFTFPVAPDAKVSGKKDALVAGDYVDLDVVEGTVVAVKVKGPGKGGNEGEHYAYITFWGTFVSATAGGITVTITELEGDREVVPNAKVGDTLTLPLASDVRILSDGKSLPVTDLKAGDLLKLQVSDGSVRSIWVQNSGHGNGQGEHGGGH